MIAQVIVQYLFWNMQKTAEKDLIRKTAQNCRKKLTVRHVHHPRVVHEGEVLQGDEVQRGRLLQLLLGCSSTAGAVVLLQLRGEQCGGRCRVGPPRGVHRKLLGG